MPPTEHPKRASEYAETKIEHAKIKMQPALERVAANDHEEHAQARECYERGVPRVKRSIGVNICTVPQRARIHQWARALDHRPTDFQNSRIPKRSTQEKVNLKPAFLHPVLRFTIPVEKNRKQKSQNSHSILYDIAQKIGKYTVITEGDLVKRVDREWGTGGRGGIAALVIPKRSAKKEDEPKAKRQGQKPSFGPNRV